MLNKSAAYSGPCCQTNVMEFYCENSLRLIVVNYFHKKNLNDT